MKSTILYSCWLSTVSRHFSEFFSCPPICRESWQWTEYQWDGRRNRGIHAPIKEKWRPFKTAFRQGGALPAKTFHPFPMHVYQQYACFFQPSIYPRTAAASFHVTMVGATPYKLFLKVPCKQAACQLWFLLQEEKKGRWCEICKKWTWENIFTPFSTASYWKKRRRWLFGRWPGKKQVQYSLLSPKTTINLW